MEKNTVHLLQEIQRAFYNPDFGQENWEGLRKKVDTALATSQPESPAPLSAEEMVDKVREILDDELDVTTDNWGHYVGTKGKDEAASRIAALLSQRQPVAPEREEWIGVDSRLPENGIPVLVHQGNKFGAFRLAIGHVMGVGKRWRIYFDNDENPLTPEP